MKKSILLFATAVVGFATLFTSCKKEDDVNVTRALIDDWSPKRFAIEDGNGTLDTSEVNQSYELWVDFGTLNFKEGNTGIFTTNSLPYGQYLPTLFGMNEEFSWTTNDKLQEITVQRVSNAPETTKIIFQDINHFAILETGINYLTYGSPVWIFYERK